MSQKQQENQKEVRAFLSDLKIEKRDNSDEQSRTIAGYALKFDKWSEPIHSWFKEKISRDALDGCDMDDVIMCFNHDSSKLLARTQSGTLELKADDVGLSFKFEAPNTELGNEMIELVSRGDIRGCSFVFYIESDSWTYADDDNGLKLDERTVEKISKIRDVSLVVFPAYEDTDVSIRSLEKKRDDYFKSKAPKGMTPESRSRQLTFLRIQNNQ